jgi:hypothetical protein
MKNCFSGKCDVMRVKTHHSLKSLVYSCVSITLPGLIAKANHNVV